ncbi:hypothetical protein [Streptococcus ruminantium]|uniref:Uncharacterized protein n=1 Tax=Streptococcus ruminantium TaxID=1917441 RepID=A0ABU1B4S0_9STRE|nr:hypothetical protein [Streptococcus ruminantium]MDQ8759564.1 hypothetical protein [Streptococcus ruminantium]MDQ8764471.1 hypothetical protein [Streptococcus ruminantium]MDQ8768591.1 hypothetical protein [Streptococcus ruminantium]MDQ8775034.1 hypothetical protein [Streptococcus ruminantium]MDQ8793966.1 hypothetical protein [Streptococcus ruminantium]
MEKDNLRFVNNFFLPYLNRVAADDKKKDTLVVLYFIWVAILSIIFFEYTFEVAKPLLYQIGILLTNVYLSLEALVYQKETFVQYSIEVFPISLVEELSDIFKFVVPMLVVVTIRANFKRISYSIELFITMLTILIYITWFDMWLQLLLVISIAGLLVLFYPIGNGYYFQIIQYINYFEDILYNNFENRTPKKRGNWKRNTLILLISLLLIYTIARLFYTSIYFSILVTLLVLFLLWMNDKKVNQAIQILKKLLTYGVFFAFTILGNLEIESNLLKLPLVFITFFFAFDRVISLSKEVHNLILEKSLLYYYDHENIKNAILMDEIIDIKYIDRVDFSEVELVRQMIIRLRLNLKDEFIYLSKLYSENNFDNYKQFVEGNVYFINFDESWLDNLTSLKNQIGKILEYKNQKIFLPKIIEEYGVILFELEEYEQSILYFEQCIMYLEKDSIERLVEAYRIIGDNEKSDRYRKLFLQ